jgi:hypothetical protein
MVIAVYEGGRRCDETCYNAKGMNCACGCGGKNHGMGLEQALRNEGMTQDEAGSIIEARAVNEQDEDIIAQEAVMANEKEQALEPPEDGNYCEDCGAPIEECLCDFMDEDEDEDYEDQ